MRCLLVIVVCMACACASPPPCDLAPVYVTGGAGRVPDAWVERAMSTAYRRVGEQDACEVMEGAEIWLYYHDARPIGCAERPPYQSCTFGVGANVHHIEVNFSAVRPGGAGTAYDIIHHELVHVLLTRMGVPAREHHQLMGSWHINTINRRRPWVHPSAH